MLYFRPESLASLPWLTLPPACPVLRSGPGLLPMVRLLLQQPAMALPSWARHLAVLAGVPCSPGLVLRGYGCDALVHGSVVALRVGDVEQLAVLLQGPHRSQGTVEEDGVQHACSNAG